MNARIDPMALRGRLENELAGLLDRVRRLDAHARETDREVPADAPDRATYREDEEVVAGIDELTRTEIASVRAALARLDDGTYGACTGCGAAIGAARLEAVPATPWCVACAPR